MCNPFASAEAVIQEFRRRGLPERFCHVPFVSLIVEPDGRVGSCRMKGTKFSVGHLGANTIEEIWNGPAIRKWRREFLRGEPASCEKEIRHFRCHTCPEYNSLLPRAELHEVQEQPPLRLALNLNGKCNLHCRMCDVYREPNGLYRARGWWAQVEKWAESAEEIELLSGEPFIQADTYRLIRHVSERNPACLWSLTTNANWRFSRAVRESLDRIRFKHLIVSLDSLDPETYGRIRRGGSLQKALGTLAQLSDYDRDRQARGLGSLNIHLAFLIQQDNWKELASFQEFGRAQSVKIFRDFLYEPAEFSLLSLSEPERERILEHYLTNLTHDQLSNSRRILLPILDSLQPSARAHFLLELLSRQPTARPVGATDTRR